MPLRPHPVGYAVPSVKSASSQDKQTLNTLSSYCFCRQIQQARHQYCFADVSASQSLPDQSTGSCELTLAKSPIFTFLRVRVWRSNFGVPRPPLALLRAFMHPSSVLQPPIGWIHTTIVIQTCLQVPAKYWGSRFAWCSCLLEGVGQMGRCRCRKWLRHDFSILVPPSRNPNLAAETNSLVISLSMASSPRRSYGLEHNDHCSGRRLAKSEV